MDLSLVYLSYMYVNAIYVLDFKCRKIVMDILSLLFRTHFYTRLSNSCTFIIIIIILFLVITSSHS